MSTPPAKWRAGYVLAESGLGVRLSTAPADGWSETGEFVLHLVISQNHVGMHLAHGDTHALRADIERGVSCAVDGDVSLDRVGSNEDRVRVISLTVLGTSEGHDAHCRTGDVSDVPGPHSRPQCQFGKSNDDGGNPPSTHVTSKSLSASTMSVIHLHANCPHTTIDASVHLCYFHCLAICARSITQML